MGEVFRWPWLLVLGLGLGAACAPTCAAAGKKSKVDVSEVFFAEGAIPTLSVEITGENLKALQTEPRKNVRATIKEGSLTYTDVALHLKGSKLGSYRSLDDKPSLTLNFDKYVDGQKFHGMDKIYLNNSVEDTTYLGEHLCAGLFRAANVPAPRVTHARVILNGKDRGLYVLKEGFDKTFLRHWFENPEGNLYEGGSRQDVTEPLEKDSGDKAGGRADLEALVRAAREPDPAKRGQRLGQLLDLERFVSFLALEVATWHWDGYAMNRNNYRLYHDPNTDKMTFVPHGMDLVFEEAEGAILPPFEGLVAAAYVGTPEGRDRYQRRLAQLVGELFQEKSLTERIDAVQARLQPVLTAMHPEAAKEQAAAAAKFRQRVLDRARFLQKATKP